MGSGSALLHIGHSGLSTSKKKLATAGHNIANVNTEGHSRQRATQQAKTPIRYGNLIVGSGSQINRIDRVHDQFLEEKIRLSVTDHNFHQERGLQLTQVENIFNEINSEGLSNVFNRFFNSFRELSKRPDSETIRSVVRDSARTVIRDLKGIKRNLDELQLNMDRKLVGNVEEINLLLRQIRDLNIKIQEIEVGAHGEAGDLQDKRDLAVKELSKYMEVSTYSDNRGQFILHGEGLGGLVAGGQVQLLASKKSPESNSYVEGGVEIYFQDRPHHKISQNIKNGKLKAVFQTRDSELKLMQKIIDDLAYDFAYSVNAIHRRGFANKIIPQGPDGIARAVASEEKVTGINFFSPPVKRHEAASNLELSDEVRKDLRNIATAWSPNSPGDNRIAIAISKLQNTKILDNQTATFEDFYLKGIGTVALESKKAAVDEEHASGILAQRNALRERVSGVSIDEETADMIRFQHTFDASARVMSVADEMFKTILGIKKI